MTHATTMPAAPEDRTLADFAHIVDQSRPTSDYGWVGNMLYWEIVEELINDRTLTGDEVEANIIAVGEDLRELVNAQQVAA